MSTKRIPLRAIEALVDYLEDDERKDYLGGYCDENGRLNNPDGKSHIYRHVKKVSDWLADR